MVGAKSSDIYDVSMEVTYLIQIRKNPGVDFLSRVSVASGLAMNSFSNKISRTLRTRAAVHYG